MGRPILTTASFSDGIKVEFESTGGSFGAQIKWASVYNNGDYLWCASLNPVCGWSIAVSPRKTDDGKIWRSSRYSSIWEALIEALDAGILDIHEVNVSRTAINHIRKFGMTWIDDFVVLDGGEVK